VLLTDPWQFLQQDGLFRLGDPHIKLLCQLAIAGHALYAFDPEFGIAAYCNLVCERFMSSVRDGISI
jgi:hypothetical protein